MDDRKTLLLLGGSRQQVVAIEVAKSCGYRTVLCDYLTDNPGQHYADVFYLVSTTDRDAVLGVARKERVDGVIAYSSDPASPTAAYVAEQLGLPSNPLETVEIMSSKSLFREHLTQNGFPCPKSCSFDAEEDVCHVRRHIEALRLPVVVKPTDSSGSKGVTVLHNLSKLSEAIDYARSYGRNGIVIVEEYISYGFPRVVGGDIFVVDGIVRFWGLMSCLRDCGSPLVPVGERMPSGLTFEQYRRTKMVLQELVTSLGIRFGELNVEVIYGADNEPYVLELGSRAGGNLIPVQLSDASGVDLVKANIRCAMGENPGFIDWEFGRVLNATFVLHSTDKGRYRGYELSGVAKETFYREVMYVEAGDVVDAFSNANKALGVLFFRFESEEQLEHFTEHFSDYVSVLVETED
ncbi:ATP-grasp domain-containing protein [Adlercreutzia sp. ZJ141]|uniref:ATP-grasp domain-containing protein n=1 Tax=Adlercreutzia sp. ZJ141 TaxID=2709406 RepID=UPI0013EA74F8|nr:ATP-grasp domain-containing protein [Adlercreutzia sp. ZJ141]